MPGRILRAENDQQNPTAARVYGSQSTYGRVDYYTKVNGQFIYTVILGEGGEAGMDGIDDFRYNGRVINPYDPSTFVGNYIFHPGLETKQIAPKNCTVTASTNEFTCNGHGYAADQKVKVYNNTGVLPAPLAEDVYYYVKLLSPPDPNKFKLMLSPASSEIDITNAGTGQIKIHAANAGYDDPVQGRPSFLPGFEDTYSGLSYAEVKIDSSIAGNDEVPDKSQIKVRGLRIWDYDAFGNHIGSAPTFSNNNARVFADLCKAGGIDYQRRIHWTSWFDYKTKSNTGINWSGGNTGTGIPIFPTITGTAVYNPENGNLIQNGTQLPGGHVHAAFTAQLTAGIQASIEGTIISPDFFIGFSLNNYTSTATNYVHGFRVTLDAGIAKLNYTTGLTSTQVGTWAYGDQLKVAIAGDDLKLYKNDLLVWVINGIPFDTNPFYGAVTLREQFAQVSNLAFKPVGTNAVPRVVKRYSSDIVFSSGTDLQVALSKVMDNSPGVHYQDVNGKLKFLTTADRPVIHNFTYDPSQDVKKSNIVYESFSSWRKNIDEKINFGYFSFRDRNDPLYREKYVPVDRPKLRQNYDDGNATDSGVIELGVMDQSLAERIGETRMRFTTDLDWIIQLKGQRDAHHVAVGDVVTVSHGSIPGFTEAKQTKFMVLQETFEPGTETAEEKSFYLQIHDPNWYSDNFHGQIYPDPDPGTPSDLTAPPLIFDLQLSERNIQNADGSYVTVLEGTIFFKDHPHQQYARVYLKRPSDSEYIPQPILVRCDPETMTGYFEITPVRTGIHHVKIVTQTISGIGRELIESVDFPYMVVGDTVIPDPPTNLEFVFDGLTLRGQFNPSISENVLGYVVKDETDKIIHRFISVPYFDESVISSTLTRRVYAISRTGVLSSGYTQATFVLADSINWRYITGSSILSDETLKKTAPTGWNNCGAVLDKALLTREVPGYLKFTADTTDQYKIIGFSDKFNVDSPDDFKLALYLQPDSTVQALWDGGSAFCGTYEEGDEFVVKVDTFDGDLTLQKISHPSGPSGESVITDLHYFPSSVTNKMPLYAGVALYTNGSVIAPQLELSGDLIPIDQLRPQADSTYTSGAAINSTNGNVTKTVNSGTSSHYASTPEDSILENRDGEYSFNAPQGISVIVGVLSEVTGSELDIDAGLKFNSDNTVVTWVEGAIGSSLGSTSGSDKWSLTRENKKIYARKNGLVVAVYNTIPSYIRTNLIPLQINFAASDLIGSAVNNLGLRLSQRMILDQDGNNLPVSRTLVKAMVGNNNTVDDIPPIRIDNLIDGQFLVSEKGVFKNQTLEFSADLTINSTVINAGSPSKFLYHKTDNTVGEGTFGTGLSFTGGVLTVTFPGLKVGDPIELGSANRILYENASHKIAESENFTYDGTRLRVGENTGLINGRMLEVTKPFFTALNEDYNLAEKLLFVNTGNSGYTRRSTSKDTLWLQGSTHYLYSASAHYSNLLLNSSSVQSYTLENGHPTTAEQAQSVAQNNSTINEMFAIVAQSYNNESNVTTLTGGHFLANSLYATTSNNVNGMVCEALGAIGATPTPNVTGGKFIARSGTTNIAGKFTALNGSTNYSIFAEAGNLYVADKVGIGTNSMNAKLNIVSTGELSRIGYDANSYETRSMSSTGALTIDVLGTNPRTIYLDPVEVPFEAYSPTAATWNSNETVTKKAIKQINSKRFIDFADSIEYANSGGSLPYNALIYTTPKTADITLSINFRPSEYAIFCVKNVSDEYSVTIQSDFGDTFDGETFFLILPNEKIWFARYASTKWETV